MSEFCKNERHGGICVKTGTYCNLGACPYEQLEQFAPVVHGRWSIGRFNRETGNYEEQCTRCRNFSKEYSKPYCPSYGERKEGGADNGV